METWKTLHYRKTGISHQESQKVCQDSVRILENDECIVAALADGLGSLEHSEIASETLTCAVCSFFAENISIIAKQIGRHPFSKVDEHIRKNLIEFVQDSIRAEADRRSFSVSSMDCNMVFVCCFKQYQIALVGRLGDCAACIIRKDNSEVLTDTSITANGTNAIFDADAVQQLFLSMYDLKRDKILGFILTSDGLENEVYMKGSSFINKNAEIYFNAWYSKTDPLQFVEKRIWQLTESIDTGFDDDISIAVLSCADKPVILQDNPTWLCTCGERNLLQETYCHACHADFSALYHSVRFRDHGGKAAYFMKINRNPDAEKEVLGLPANRKEVVGQTLNFSQPNISQPINTKQPGISNAVTKTTMPHSGKKKSSGTTGLLLATMVLALTIGLVVGCITGFTLQNRKMRNLNEMLQDASDTEDMLQHELDETNDLLRIAQENLLKQQQEDAGTSSLPDTFHVLSSGDLFWGNLDQNGRASGYGFMISDGSCYCGYFDNGLREGNFTIIDSEKNLSYQEYHMNMPVQPENNNNIIPENNPDAQPGDVSGPVPNASIW